MRFAAGALVRARGRDWVVLPESRPTQELLILRPLGGTDDEITGIYQPLEPVEPANIALPDPALELGNHLSCGLLREAVRLRVRTGAGPFRSLGRIAVEPRPYQLVPLLMALRLDPVRLLIADDVGVGKSVEAALIARELLDRAEIRSLAVLCPPSLAEQWQQTLREQFHIPAELVLSSTAVRLERECSVGEAVFERYPFTIISTDYIKQELRRNEFLRTCPDLVIVDEAHACAAGASGLRQQRHDLLQRLIDPSSERGRSRHLLLVTATPHSGNEQAFRSLLGLLDPDFKDLPEDLSGEPQRRTRERLAQHVVQRRRQDLLRYLDSETPFPQRETADAHYRLSPAYRQLIDRALAYCREQVGEADLDQVRQRVRWWSALSLLRAFSSSPAAAAATLRQRAAFDESESLEQIDAEGRRLVLDTDAEEEASDAISGARLGQRTEERTAGRSPLSELAAQLERLDSADDAKLRQAVPLVQQLVADGYSPVVFCRFIATADYLAEALAERLQGVAVESVTGELPPPLREQRIASLVESPRRVLVCTDCLSEGINLQHRFDAVMHYDLSWNPTRHEQREGRVDRYGQPRARVRTLTYFGADNPVDGIVLEVLRRKQSAIDKRLGVKVSSDLDSAQIEQAMLEGLLLRKQRAGKQLALDLAPAKKAGAAFHWTLVQDDGAVSRTVFAQNQLLVAINRGVAREIEEARRALGNASDVRRFLHAAFRACGATVGADEQSLAVELTDLAPALRDALGELGQADRLRACFSPPEQPGTVVVGRTHPLVDALAGHVLEGALDPCTRDGAPARRCGVIRTRDVERRTTVLLLRLRFHLIGRARNGTVVPLLAEDHALAGFCGTPQDPTWLPEERLEPLLGVQAHANILAVQARDHLRRVVDAFAGLQPELDALAERRAQALLEAHRRVRTAARASLQALRVEVHKPVDVLGLFIYLPLAGGGVG